MEPQAVFAGDVPPEPPSGPPHWRAWARRAALWLLAALGLLAGALTLFFLAMAPRAPSVNELHAVQAARPSVLMSADGKPLFEFKRAQQKAVSLDKVSPHVLHALLATEDRRFYDHDGLDYYRMAGAAVRTLMGDTQGGSTITQQLARNLFPDKIGRERTLTRKAKELITAVRIERTFSKDEILEKYLNTAPFLYNVVGIEMAARAYFAKSAADLNELESATLIGMLKGTRYYNPVLNPERAKERRNVVLSQMVKHGWLDEAQYHRLRGQSLNVTLNLEPEGRIEAPHFVMQMRKWLVDWADEREYNLYSDGLVIHTTIDSRLQEAAVRAVERQTELLQAVADVEWSSPSARLVSTSMTAYAAQRKKAEPFAYFWKQRADLLVQAMRESTEYKQALKKHGSDAAALRALAADGEFVARLKREKTRLEAGFVAMDPATGEVKAWVGGRNFNESQFDHVMQAERQPGSTFKPFAYGAALEAGFPPHKTYMDEPVEIALANGTRWRPTDMSGSSGMPMTLHDGLVYSKNTVTAQVAQEVGATRIASLARTMGVDSSKLDPVPSIALGTSPVTLLEMVTAYSTIAQQGQYRKPVMIRRITDRDGRVLQEFIGETRRAMSPEAAIDLIDMMRGVVQRGTGTQIRTRFGVAGDVAGKTGTTQNNTDGWFILMHPNLVAGAWVGFNDQRVSMRSDYWGQGGHNALLLVGDFFKAAQRMGAADTRAQFPPARQRIPIPVLDDGSEIWASGRYGEDTPTELKMPDKTTSTSEAIERGDIIVMRQRDGSLFIGDRAAVTGAKPTGRRQPMPRSPEAEPLLHEVSSDTDVVPVVTQDMSDVLPVSAD